MSHRFWPLILALLSAPTHAQVFVIDTGEAILDESDVYEYGVVRGDASVRIEGARFTGRAPFGLGGAGLATVVSLDQSQVVLESGELPLGITASGNSTVDILGGSYERAESAEEARVEFRDGYLGFAAASHESTFRMTGGTIRGEVSWSVLLGGSARFELEDGTLLGDVSCAGTSELWIRAGFVLGLARTSDDSKLTLEGGVVEHISAGGTSPVQISGGIVLNGISALDEVWLDGGAVYGEIRLVSRAELTATGGAIQDHVRLEEDSIARFIGRAFRVDLDGDGLPETTLDLTDATRTIEPDDSLWIDQEDDDQTRSVAIEAVWADGSASPIRLLHETADPDTWSGRIELERVCPCDLVGLGALTVDDLLVYLDRWFEQDDRADLNGDATTTVADLLIFLDCWLAGDSGC